MMKTTGKLVSMTLLSAALASGSLISAAADSSDPYPEDLFACTTSRDEKNDIVLDFKDFQMTLPASWGEACKISTTDSAADFMHKASRDAYTEELDLGPCGGILFTIYYTQDLEFLASAPAFEILGNGEQGCYYVAYPTDVQGCMDDEAIWQEYVEVCEEIESVIDSVTFKEEGAGIHSPEYILLPASATRLLTEEDAEGLSAADLQMAINEIYALHHRKFVLPEVQEYFSDKSWYEGFIEPESFDVSNMNSYETQNINLMLQWMEARN